MNDNKFSWDDFAAEVVSVDYKAGNDEKLYSVRCKPLHGYGVSTTNDTVTARPIDSNLKKIPIAGEIVRVVSGPTSYGAAVKQTNEFYIVGTYPVQSSIHHNGMPGKHKIESSDSSTDYNSAQHGHSKTSKSSKTQSKIEEAFPEMHDVKPMQPYSGDVLIEGRFGQTIRMSSTLKDGSNEFNVAPHWKRGESSDGYPITTVVNTKSNSGGGVFTTENIDKDDSSLYLTSGQEVPYTLASTNLKSMARLNNDTFRTDTKKYSGNQILMASGRILLNARSKEVLIVGKRGVGITAGDNITMDSGNTIEMESNRINLGLNATHPAVLGDDATSWLSSLLDTLKNLCNQLTVETHMTGFGPSSPPINAAAYGKLQNELVVLQKRLPELLSKLVYLNKLPS